MSQSNTSSNDAISMATSQLSYVFASCKLSTNVSLRQPQLQKTNFIRKLISINYWSGCHNYIYSYNVTFNSSFCCLCIILIYFILFLFQYKFHCIHVGQQLETLVTFSSLIQRLIYPTSYNPNKKISLKLHQGGYC